jgi:starch synthase (maltosyl-transferring)
MLGTVADFKSLVAKAKKMGIEVAMDFALQAAPDHPWVTSHPDWFKQRPDGSIQYAENPPKKYQDIYPIYFESKDWKAMWDEFHRILEYWIGLGVNVFRVDNPHTKPFGFWEWIIASVKKSHPDVLFLSEAFTRPEVMQELTRGGFTQSYSYFTWRNNKAELIQYMNELTSGHMSETFRPNFWPNTPDINPWSLQNPDEHQYRTRYFLAATLSSNCGVYGPVYELMDHRSVPGKEEYWDSEKFQIRHWNWETRNRITETYTKVNEARKTQRALQRTNNIQFLELPNDQLMAYLKTGDDGSHVLCVVSLDGYNTQAGQLKLHPSLVNKAYHETMQLTDLMDGAKYDWRGESHFVQLSPDRPFHLFQIS